MVVSTWPDTFARIEATREPAVIQYSERISESPTRGTLEEAVLISPFTGEHQVEHSRSGLEISVIGGFQPGLVYRIRILPTVKDMFGNPMLEPFELVFSTGGEFEANVLAGLVRDRITMEPVEQARVEARPADEEGEEDVPVYLSTTDTAGIYLLRYLPSGSYTVTAYQDNNRNEEPDFTEAQEATTVALGVREGVADTLIDRLTILQPDTIPAMLVRAEAEDSMTLRLTFDDYLVVGSSLTDVRVTLTPSQEETGEAEEEEEQEEAEKEEQAPQEAPAVERLLWGPQLDSIRAYADSVRAADSLRAVADSLQMVLDSLETVLASLQARAADSTEIEPVAAEMEAIRERVEPAEVEEETVQEEEPGPAEPEPVLPETFFYALLAAPLLPDQLYDVRVTGVWNIAGVRGGGGEAEVRWTPPEPDTTAVQDTTAVPDTAVVPDTTGGAPPDTTVAPSDTTGAVGDSVTAPPDTAVVPDTTGGAPPDTTGAPPDTTVAPPDTTVAPPDTTAFPANLKRRHPGRETASGVPSTGEEREGEGVP
jgi:hypothetical protein